MLHVQKALREIGPDAVQERYFVKYRTHKRFPHLFGWKYTCVHACPLLICDSL